MIGEGVCTKFLPLNHTYLNFFFYLFIIFFLSFTSFDMANKISFINQPQKWYKIDLSEKEKKNNIKNWMIYYSNYTLKRKKKHYIKI